MRILLMTAAMMLFFGIGCRKQNIVIPKPRTYPKIDFPAKKYNTFDESYCSFKFDLPVYGHIERDEYFFDQQPLDSCWFDLVISSFNARVHCSYFPITDRTQFDKLVSDAFQLIEKHRIKANFIEESPVQKENRVYGLIFQLSGPVASPMQFFLTDSSNHFLRAALYFNNPPNPDSMDIVYDFVEQDLFQMIRSFEWRGQP